MLSLREYMQIKNYDGVASFFHIIPDQAHTLLQDPYVVDMLKANEGTTSNYYKWEIYSKYFAIEPRPKYTGFEELETLENYLRLELAKRYHNSNHNEEVTKYRGIFIKDNQLYEPVGRPDKFISVLPGLNNASNFKEACIMAAKKTQELAGDKQIFVCMSGGLDSEFAAMCYKEARVPFKAFIFNYNGKNKLDTDYAFKWCRENNIDTVVEVLDLEKFAEKEMFEYAHFSGVTSPHILTFQKMLTVINKKYQGYPVLGGELRLLYKEGNFMFAFQWEKGEMHFMTPEK